MLWQVKQVTSAAGKAANEVLADAVATLPVAPELAIRRVLWNLRGADAANTEAAMEQAERELASLLAHDSPHAE